MNYRVVADSSSSVYAMDCVDFRSVPLKIIAGDHEYVDTPDLDVTDMVNTLLSYKGKSGTSCPNSGEWLDAFGDADCIFAVTITSNLSGSYAAARIAREEYLEQHPNAKVYIVDSLSAGPELVLILEKLAELIRAELPFDEIVEKIQAYQQHTHLLFSLESLKNLANNGRVSHAVAAVAGVLGIRLFGKASDEGTLEPMHKCRSTKQLMRTYLAEMKNMNFCGGKVRISHCFNETAAQQLADTIRAEFPDSDIQIDACGGLCSFYAEKGGMLVGVEG